MRQLAVLLVLLSAACQTPSPIDSQAQALQLFPTPLSGLPAELGYVTTSTNPRGDTLVAWTQVTSMVPGKLGPGAVTSVLQARFRPAGGGWGPTQQVSVSGHFVIFPKCAVDANGRAFVVWLEETSNYDVMAAVRTPSGAWSAPASITQGGARLINQEQPDLAVDARGDAITVWHQLDDRSLFAATSARYDVGSASWSAPAYVDPTGDSAGESRLIVDGAGNGYLASISGGQGGDTYVVQLRRLPAGATSWLAPEAAAPASAFSILGARPDLVVDGQGGVTIVWNEPASGGGDVVRAVSSAAGGGWSPAVTLSAASTGVAGNFGGPMPRVVVDGAGNVVAAWTQLVGSGSASPSVIESATRDHLSGAWSAAQALSSPSDTAGLPQLACDPAGDVAVSWLHSGFLSQPLTRALRPHGGAWSHPADLWSLGYAFSDELGMDAAGNVTYAWLLTVDALGFVGTVEADSESAR
jgi:hypothetical protein